MTNLYYLGEMDVLVGEATILHAGRRDGKDILVLDGTYFYPQGGGQPSDVGSIQGKYGTFEVGKVIFDDEKGEVIHEGRAMGELLEGDDVVMHVDNLTRLLHSKFHSGGHLVDLVISLLQLSVNPVRGHHVPGEAYVSYEGNLELLENALDKIQGRVNELIAEDIEVHSYTPSDEELQEYHLVAPKGKTIQVCRMGTYPPVGCGGTHVISTGKLGGLVITGVKRKKGVMKIKYEFE